MSPIRLVLESSISPGRMGYPLSVYGGCCNMKLGTKNKGLTVKLNLWSLEKFLDDFDSRKARLWVIGEVTNAETDEKSKFNDAGELITILGKWNASKFRQLRKEAKAPTRPV